MVKFRKYKFDTPNGQRVEASLLKGYVVLFVAEDYWIAAKGYSLYKYDVATQKWSYWSRLVDKKSALLSRFKLSRRLFRAEITHLYHFANDVWMCIAKRAIFRYNPTTKLFEKCCTIEKGSRPMALCQDRGGVIYYGEYFYNPERKPVRIFASKDNGDTWATVYTFQDGEINHIHGIFNHENRLWLATGDDDVACIFGYTEDGFKTLVKAWSGSQMYRVCVPLFVDDKIIFATDSQYEPNVIRMLDGATGRMQNLASIQGSGIYAVANGRAMAVSTTVEPSEVNLDKSSHLWFSIDGKEWKEIVAFRKDCWKATLFQFGSIRFPHYESPSSNLIITGRAIKTLDQNTLIIPIDSIK